MSGNDERRYKFHIERYGHGARNDPLPGRSFTEESILVDTREVADWIGWKHEEHFLNRGENHRRNDNGTISRDIRYESETYWFIHFSTLEDLLVFAESERKVVMRIGNNGFVGCVGSITIYD